MRWDGLKEWFGRRTAPPIARNETSEAKLSKVPWVDPDDNPWHVAILDLRPVTQTLLATSGDEQCASNLTSLAQDDGTGFIGIAPGGRTTPIGLRYRVDPVLADGVLFAPHEMEHKWAIYFHHSRLIFVRSWTRQVRVVAEVRADGDQIEVTTLSGFFWSEDEEPSFSLRALDYLLRSYVLDRPYPAPLNAGMEVNPQWAAMWCFSLFGNRALFATPYPLATILPEEPLRTVSLLHIAVARGDPEALRSALGSGIPPDLFARDGLTPLHWALAGKTEMIEILLDSGAAVDNRSRAGATPLMDAVQAGNIEILELLINRGADVNAADSRGFTCLHRAAEIGTLDSVQCLLDRGAFPHAEADGHTPLSLAEKRKDEKIVALLERYGKRKA